MGKTAVLQDLILLCLYTLVSDCACVCVRAGVSWGFVYLFLKKEGNKRGHGIGWIRSCEGAGRVGEGGKCDQNILYKKDF